MHSSHCESTLQAFPCDNGGPDQATDLDTAPSVIVIALGVFILVLLQSRTLKRMLMLHRRLGTNDEALKVSAPDFINTMRAFVSRLLVSDTRANRVKHICFIVSSALFVRHIAP